MYDIINGYENKKGEVRSVLPDSEYIIPVMIGYDRPCAAGLRQRFGRLHIFSASRNPFLRLNPFARFHRVPPCEPPILALYLRDFAAKNDGCTPLVTASADNAALLSSLAPFIEDFCFVAPIEELLPSGKE